MPYYRILHLLNDPHGLAGRSEQLCSALADAGHGVTSVRPSEAPWLFEGGSTVDDGLASFIRRSKPQIIIASDGIGIDEKDLAHAAAAAVAVLSIDAEGAVRLLGEGAKSTADGHAQDDPVFRFSPAMSEGYRATELANLIANPPCVLVAQPKTPEIAQLAEQLREELRAAGNDLAVTGIGDGWPEPPRERRATALAYASRSAVATVLFPTTSEGSAPADPQTGSEADAAVVAAALADGVPIVAIGEASAPAYAHPHAVSACADVHDAVHIVLERAEHASCGSEWSPAPRPESLLSTPSLDRQVESLLAELRLEDILGEGFPNPAVYACACGYYGTGNFGDEMILAHLAQRIEARYGLAVMSAIAAVPDAVWRDHGIESMAVGDHARIARAFERARALVITAGLLFDQGMRWTCGSGSLADGAGATDLPGLFGITALARATDVPVLFYGTGDGPLELEPSRRCVALAADAGARFYPRNAETARLLAACGVPRGSVVEASDALYGLEDPGVEPAAAWARTAGIDLAHDKVVVVSLRSWPGLAPGWERLAAHALDRMADAGCTIVFVDFAPEDRIVHDAVAAELHHQDRCVMHGPAHDRNEVLSLLAHAWAGFAMRLHCSLVMGRFGLPSVGIAYLPKVEALFSQLGMEQLLVPLAFSEADLDRAVTNLLDNRDAIATAARRNALRERKKLERATSDLDAALDAQRNPPERRFWVVSQSESELRRARIADLETQIERAAEEKRALEERLRDQERIAAEARADADEVRSSTSFRVGHAIVAPFAWLRRLGRHEK